MPNFLVANLCNSSLLRAYRVHAYRVHAYRVHAYRVHAYRASNLGIFDGLKLSKLNQNFLTNLDNQQMENT